MGSRKFNSLYNEMVVEYVMGRDVGSLLVLRGYSSEFSEHFTNFVRWHADKSVSVEEISRARSYLSTYGDDSDSDWE